MTVKDDKSDIYFEIENQMHFLKEMQGEVHYELIRIKQNSLLEAAAKKIPMLAEFLRKVNKVGEATINLGENIDVFHDTKITESISHGFHFGGIAIAAFDFIRIPLIYLTALVLKEDVPLNLNNNARWLYAAVILGLTITAFLVPITAPVIAFVAAGIGLVVSSFLLGKILYERYQLNRLNKQFKKELNLELDEMDLIQHDAARLEAALGEAREEEHIAVIFQEIEIFKERFDSQKEMVEKVKNKQLKLDQKIQAMKMSKVLDRSVAIILATISIIGLIISISFPPIGLGILAGAAIGGFTYIAARIIYGVAIWVSSKFKASKEADNKSLENDIGEGVGFDDELVHESTADVFYGLKKKGLQISTSQIDDFDEDINIKEKASKKIVSRDSIFTDSDITDDDDDDGDGDREKEGENPTDIEPTHH